MAQIREQVHFTKGRIIVRGKLVTRGKAKFADYILYYKPNIPIALIEAKDNNHPVGGGMQQGLDYAATLDIPFVFSSNGDAFLFHDRTGLGSQTETELSLDAFPTPQQLWAKYRTWKGLVPAEEEIVLQDYFDDASGKEPRYYQRIAINKTIEAIAKGQDRILLVMATGTGKTYTAFQIIWRLWKAGRKKRVLYLADRNVLIDQTMVNDFRPFGGAMAKLSTSSKTIERRDGFLAPYKVVKVHLDVDVEGYRPAPGERDKHGHEIEDRNYNQKDFDRNLVIDERTKRVARRVSEFLKQSGDRFQKTIVFCVDTEHAARMRQGLINENPDLVQQNERYVMRITGDDAEGCAEVGNFIDPEAKYPVIVTTSRLLEEGGSRAVRQSQRFSQLMEQCGAQTSDRR
jgi:type I site-specific restriction endonuclease